MFHIGYLRLIQLSTEAVIRDRTEAAHLRYCEDCQILLHTIAEERSRDLERQRNKSYQNFRELEKTA